MRNILLPTATILLLAACGTALSTTSETKVVSIRRSAAFILADCSGDGGACKPSQVRALATSIDCAAASVQDDAKLKVDAGPSCPKASP